MSADYKTSKEAFVSGMTGSSIGHINMVSLAALSSIALYSTSRTRLPFDISAAFLIEYAILTVSLLLSITLFANSPATLNIILLALTGLLFLLPRRQSGTQLPSNETLSTNMINSNVETTMSSLTQITPLPALTTYRSHMLLLTFLSILAVDFPVFPRFLVKCETFGVSLMDIGVGSFVFSQGIVSAAPLIKNPRHLIGSWTTKLRTALGKTLPLLVIGIIRTISVKGVEYPEHQTEYGTHWNFFLTFGLIPSLEVLVHPLLARFPIALVALAIGIVHQVTLSHGLMDYILHAPRTSFVSANKEGIISLIGYLAIHLLGLSTGTLILPPSPSFYRRRRQRGSSTDTGKPDLSETRENGKTAIELFSYAVVWWTLLGVLMLLGVGTEVSRRVVNLQYIIWIAAYNTSFILGYLLLDLAFFASSSSQSKYSPISKLKVHPEPTVQGQVSRANGPGSNAPRLLEAINRNGLILFLLANVLTGLVNLSLPTMYMSDASAMVVLVLYSLIICGIAWTFRDRRIWKM